MESKIALLGVILAFLLCIITGFGGALLVYRLIISLFNDSSGGLAVGLSIFGPVMLIASFFLGRIGFRLLADARSPSSDTGMTLGRLYILVAALLFVFAAIIYSLLVNHGDILTVIEFLPLTILGMSLYAAPIVLLVVIIRRALHK